MMKSVIVQLTDIAVEDLAVIKEPVLSEIHHRIELIGSYPDLGPLLGPTHPGVRVLAIPPFRMFYKQVSETRVHILYIRHCRRSMP